MSDLSTSTPQSYLDFAGLGALRGQAQQKTDKATRDTATQFEAMFIQEMLKSMRQATEKSDLMGSDSLETFEQMYDKELSMQMAKRNSLGIADMIVKNVEQNKAAAEAAVKAAAAGQAGLGKPEPIALHPENKGMALSGAQQGVLLPRPEKFALKPAAAAGRAVNAPDGAGADK